MSLKLYGTAHSSAAFRVRIALNLKRLAHAHAFVDLGQDRQLRPEYLAVNPQGLVPALVDGEVVLTQSMAILEYLEERWPQPPLLPAAPAERARVRALALAVACEIHPLNNRRVRRYLAHDLGLDQATRRQWYRHWIATGLAALEALTAGHPATAAFCHGAGPTFADICLVPQIFNARRANCPLDPYPTLMGIFDNCMALAAFDQAQPAKQADIAPM